MYLWNIGHVSPQSLNSELKHATINIKSLKFYHIRRRTVQIEAIDTNAVCVNFCVEPRGIRSLFSIAEKLKLAMTCVDLRYRLIKAYVLYTRSLYELTVYRL